MAWVPIAVTAVDRILSGLLGGGNNNDEAERARAEAEQARRNADALQSQLEDFEAKQKSWVEDLEKEMKAREEQDEKHNAAMLEMEAKNAADREQHKEEMKVFRKEALEAEKRILGERLTDLKREERRLNRVYQTKYGEMEDLNNQVEMEVAKIQQFEPELTDPSIKRIVLLGLTGDGKSTLANRLAGDRSEDGNKGPFKTSGGALSETQAVVKVLSEMFGVKISVVDTPGISDSSGRGRDRQHITNLVEYLRGCGGVNQFLILKNSQSVRLSNVYIGMLRELEQALGEGFWRFVTVVLTRVEGRRGLRDFPKYKQELCDQISQMFDVPALDAIGIGIDDYDEVLSDIVTRVVPGDKFICDRLTSPLEELQANLAALKEEVVADRHEFDLVELKIKQMKKSLGDIGEKLAELSKS